jgi:CubicO group peptidase (beta-lactamase class C family)
MQDTVCHVSKNDYITPFFVDKNRLLKIKKLLPNIEKTYKDYAEKNHFPGYAFGIMVDGKLIHSGSAGFINLKEKIPATTQSMFRIASMTKSFIAMAIIKLRDERKLRLDEAVYFYLPGIKHQKLTKDSPEITIRDLLIHSAGLPKDDPWADRNLNRTEDELISFIQQGISFSNVPGITYDYSNLTYALLGIIIQKVTGISFQEYIAKNIWEPLGMKQACWEYKKVSRDELAQGYRWINNEWKEEELLSDGIFGAMGGMITSIESFSRYVALHQTAWPPRDEPEMEWIRRSSIREMHQPWRFHELNINYQYSYDQRSFLSRAYGYGLRWLQDSNRRVFVGHGGGLPGFGSHWYIMPDYGIGVILFANITYAVAGDEIHLPILDMIIKEATLQPRNLPSSYALKNKQKALLQLLPDWKNINNIFSDNFFLDNSRDILQKETIKLFEKAGKIIQIEEMIAENQLSGYFVMKGEQSSLKISFSLTPHFPALIQKLAIEEVEVEM